MNAVTHKYTPNDETDRDRSRVTEIEDYIEMGLANDPMVQLRISPNGRAVQMEMHGERNADIVRFAADGLITRVYAAQPRKDWRIVKAFDAEMDG